MRALKQTWSLFLLAAAIAGCGGIVRESSGGGASTVRLAVISEFEPATRILPGYADTLRVTVTPPAGVILPGSFPNPFLLTRASASLTIDGLAPSSLPYVLDMEALTSGSVVGTVQRSIVMTAGEFREIIVSANLQSAVDSVTVEGVSLLKWGEGTQLTAFARDAQGAALFSGAGFTWSSSDPGLLSVNQDTGLATSNGSGTATVTATLSGTSLAGQLGVTVNSKIAFQSGLDIFVIQEDGSGQTNLTNNPSAADSNPSFSPDGLTVAFESRRDGDSEIYLMNADGSGQTNLTNNAAALDVGPAFSPDGLKIAFASFRGGIFDIYVMNADGTGLTNLTNNAAADENPTFSPDGSRIAFSSARSGSFEIHVMNADGTGAVQLTNFGSLTFGSAYSPDGSKIAFRSNHDGNFEIYVMNSDGTGVTRLTNNSDQDLHPAFSPDGSKIAFASNRDGRNQIYVMNADGTGVARLTNNAFDDDFNPSFPLR